jgi:positive phototaxis protein PixI
MNQIIENSQQFLSFRIGHHIRAMLSVQHLAEVITITTEAMVPIPYAATAVIGVHNWRGDVLWLVDLGCALKMPPIVHRHHPLTKYSVIIVNHPKGKIGLVVEQIEQMLWLDPAVIQPIDAKANPAGSTTSPCINGTWQPPDRQSSSLQETILEINLAALIQILHVRS